MTERLGCPECGSVLDDLQAELNAELAVRDQTILDLSNRLSQQQGQIRKLRNQQNGSPALDPHMGDANEVFEYWRRKLKPKAREFGADRRDKVLARLRGGATVEELKLAVDGCALSEFHTKSGEYASRGGALYTDLGKHICCSEAKVLGFIEIAEARSPAPVQVIPHERLGTMQSQLDDPAILERLGELRGWIAEAVLGLGLGLDRGRVVFPIHDAAGRLVGVHRYQPNPERREGPKMVAQGARELFPAPETIEASSIWLVEGEPDAVAIRSAGLPGVAVPGVATWKDGWAERFEGFDRVYVCFDCDREGREAGATRVGQLGKVTHAIPVDLDPERDDGYDVGDLLLELGEGTAARLSALTVPRSATVQPLRQPREDPFEKVCRKLEDHDCRVKPLGEGRATAQCPIHDDRVPSLNVSRAENGTALLHCHAGCPTSEICDVLGIEQRELFAA